MVQGQKGDAIVKRLRSDEDIFLMFNQHCHTFKTFESNGRDKLCTNLREVYFSEGLGMASPIKLRNPLSYDVIPMGEKEDGDKNYCLMALDWKTVNVKQGEPVYLSKEKLLEILTALGVEP